MSVEIIFLVWLLGIGLLVSELFVPGIIMGSLGALAVVGSIVAMFVGHGPMYGGLLSLMSLAIGGVIAWVAAKRVTHRHVQNASEGYVGTDDRTALIGQTGVTATTLRPGGFATIGGQRIDVVTNGEMIDVGTPVEVVEVEGNRVQVRKAEKA